MKNTEANQECQTKNHSTMQNNIYNFALRSNNINVETLCEMCDMMDETMRDRLVNAVLGIVDHKQVAENLPDASRIYNRDCRLLSFNYLTDVVRYEYDSTVTRYYRTEEEAKRFSEEARGRWDGSDKKDDTHPFVGSYTFHETSSCSAKEWESGCK